MKLPRNVTIAQEPCTPMLFAEMTPMMIDHWGEVGHFKELPLNLNYLLYDNASRAGLLRTVVVRRDGRLVGYAVFFVSTDPHRSHLKQATQDAIYLEKASRGSIGVALVMMCDQLLKDEGVTIIYRHSDPKAKYSKLLEKLGYEATNVVYAKRLN